MLKMRILIVEDEPIIARRIKRMVQAIIDQKELQIAICNSVDQGMQYLAENEIDLLFLDLNLHGEDGFEILEKMVAAPFHTIIISANKDRAITAFEYGVLDFVPKPFNQERLTRALERFSGSENKSGQSNAKYLAIQKRGRHQLLEVQELMYIKGAGIYTELFFENGKKEIHNKSLEKLSQLLPEQFDRIHKSYIVNAQFIEELLVEGGGKYSVILKNGAELPISRSRYKTLRDKWSI